jgi:hypothetical protein
MKTKISTFIIEILIITFLQSCKTETFDYAEPDPAYPTIYPILSVQELEMKTKLLNEIKDSFDKVELNQYGFLNMTYSYTDTFTINISKIKDVIFEKINRYHSFLGLDVFQFSTFMDVFYYEIPGFPGSYFIKDEETFNTYLNGSLRSYRNTTSCVVLQDKFQGYMMENTLIRITFYKNENKMQISGFWFPDIYIPETDAIAVGDAVNIVLNDFVDYSQGISYNFNIESMIKYGKKVILPTIINGNHELRICWKINLSEYDIYYYIDSQTGEILKKLDYSWKI